MSPADNDNKETRFGIDKAFVEETVLVVGGVYLGTIAYVALTALRFGNVGGITTAIPYVLGNGVLLGTAVVAIMGLSLYTLFYITRRVPPQN